MCTLPSHTFPNVSSFCWVTFFFSTCPLFCFPLLLSPSSSSPPLPYLVLSSLLHLVRPFHITSTFSSFRPLCLSFALFIFPVTPQPSCFLSSPLPTHPLPSSLDSFSLSSFFIAVPLLASLPSSLLHPSSISSVLSLPFSSPSALSFSPIFASFLLLFTISSLCE